MNLPCYIKVNHLFFIKESLLLNMCSVLLLRVFEYDFWVIKKTFYWSIKKKIARVFEWLTRTKKSFQRESWPKMINPNSSRSRSCLSFQDDCLLSPSSFFILGFLKPSNYHWPNRLGRIILAEFFDKIGLSFVFDGPWWGVLSLFNRVRNPPPPVRYEG